MHNKLITNLFNTLVIFNDVHTEQSHESKTKGLNLDDRQLSWTDAIISSMTPAERKNPSIIDGSRRSRISKGSGRPVQEINQLLKQFAEMKKMMKKMGKMKIPKNLKQQMLGLN